MADLLLEVGSEEMPPGAVAPALDQLRSALRAALIEARLGDVQVETFGTPRRLIALAHGVAERQPDQERTVRGPSVSVAYDAEGRPTGAATGFSRKQGVRVEDLERIETPQGEYVQARVTEAGEPAADALAARIPAVLRGLVFPKMMRWGSEGMRYVRPVRWIVALLDQQVIPAEFAGVRAGRESRGHRFLSPSAFRVESPAALLSQLLDAYVVADPEERRRRIRAQADELATNAGGAVPWDESLLDENVWLVEWPTAVVGEFDPRFLALPRPVLVTAMKKHQRFFPLEDTSGVLLPRFIAIRNGGDRAIDIVREGYERVLAARFNDAEYFYEQDRQVPLQEMTQKLERILFQEKLGTLADKRRRLEYLSVAMARAKGWTQERAAALQRAASLCKADLASQMVTELPALQGIVGREYALAAGVDPEVADAIAEHYLPRAAGEPGPNSEMGRLLAVADRIDTLVGCVGIGLTPTGSSDPYGLRRAAQGVVQILAEDPDMPSLLELEIQAADAYHQVNGIDFDVDRLCNTLTGIFDPRIEAYLEERGVRYDLVAASLSGGVLYSTLVHAVVRRAETLQVLSGLPDFAETRRVAERVANILRSADATSQGPLLPGKEGIHGQEAHSVERALALLEGQSRKVQSALLRESAERELFEVASRLMPEAARRAAAYDFEGLFRALVPLRPAVDRFFDAVLVMAEDPALRANRLALLSLVNLLYLTLADFTRVVAG